MSQTRGFTLIEILVVLAMVGILAGLLMSSPPDRRIREARLEAERLHALLKYAGNEAVLAGVELGLSISRDGYEFLQFDASEGTWLSPVDPVLRKRHLPPDLRLELDSETRPSLPGWQQEDGSRRDERSPALLLLSSGETTPFELSVGTQEVGSFQIRSDGFSGIHLGEFDEAP